MQCAGARHKIHCVKPVAPWAVLSNLTHVGPFLINTFVIFNIQLDFINANGYHLD